MKRRNFLGRVMGALAAASVVNRLPAELPDDDDVSHELAVEDAMDSPVEDAPLRSSGHTMTLTLW